MSRRRWRPPAGLIARAPIAAVAAGLGLGIGAWLLRRPIAAEVFWAAATAVALAPLTVGVARALVRGRLGVDVIALLAMAGSLALGQYLAGAVVALMLAGGQELERYAAGRARRELARLASRAPRSVHRYEGDAPVQQPVEAVRRDDRLLVKTGEVVPVDGIVRSPAAVLDESALTGEPRPITHLVGDLVRSGTVNAGDAFDLRATGTAEESTYAAILRLVKEAQAAKAPLVRLADRYSLVFLTVTLTVAGGTWLWSDDPVRALAVLVIATPCPLILAPPVALVSGISRAARRGVIVKGGGALETLGRARLLLLDKTGTLTLGTPRVRTVESLGQMPPLEVLRLAASLDQASAHVFATAIVAAAREQGVRLEFPTKAVEELGQGIAGEVAGQAVRVGRAAWVVGPSELGTAGAAIKRRAAMEGISNVFVAVDGALAGAILLDDPIRSDTVEAVRALRRAGIERVIVVTGDHALAGDRIGRQIGADLVLADRRPEDKLEAVRHARESGVTVMAGDGINDAPALAAADVGVALAGRGATASSEAADVVLVVNRLDRLAEAVGIARRTRRIAIESIVAGMLLSSLGMMLAAAGLLQPVVGAMAQEAIDVAVIVNALRALAAPRMALPATRRGLLPGFADGEVDADRGLKAEQIPR